MVLGLVNTVLQNQLVNSKYKYAILITAKIMVRNSEKQTKRKLYKYIIKIR